MRKIRPIKKIKMLDPRFKTLCFMPSIIGHEQGKAIVDENDKKSSFLFF
jgi:hypothetical protein